MNDTTKRPRTSKTVAAKVNTRKATAASSPATSEAKAKFASAVEEARQGATAASKALGEKAGELKTKISADAKTYGGQAKDKAGELANDGKARASDAIASIGKAVAESSNVIDEKLGTKYGDYARTAARSLEETAAKIEAKDLNELGEDAREFVRKSPAVAVGVAAVAGFLLARLFKGSNND